jgi:DNA polymerase-4
MATLGIETGTDLKKRDLTFLQKHFGKAATYYYGAARGIDDRPVRDRETRKSVSVEDTFATDLTDETALIHELAQVAERLCIRIDRAGAVGRTVTLKIKLADFRILTRSRTHPQPVHDRAQIFETGCALLRAELPLPLGARLLGLGLHNLAAEEETAEPDQLELAI